MADAQVKEALVTPRGVRIVYRARQGARGAYLLFRQTRFEAERLGASEIRPLIEWLERIINHLTAPALEGIPYAAQH